MINNDFIIEKCFFCGNKTVWQNVGYSICLVKCYNCGHYYIDIDSEWVCNDRKKEVAKYLRLCNHSNRDYLRELPYIGINDDIKGLLVLPYRFICLSSIIANFQTKIKK